MRKVLFLSSVAFAAVTASPAIAQTTAAPPAADQAPAKQDQSEIIVTGTRALGRTRLDTIAPVDVLSSTELKRQGTTETAAALANVAPSIDFPRPAVTDATDAVRPATLRGLSPDQTLVLINSVRAHPSALLNINGSVGRGAAAVDLNTVPVAALQSVEVLRDGASALYGSDAIAGVINLRLRHEKTGGGASFNVGEFSTHVPAPLDPRSETDGRTITASAWQNLRIGSDGYLDLTGEYLDRNPTSRGDFDTRDAPKVRSRFGDPDVHQYTGYANMGVPIGTTGWDFVGWGGYQFRRTQSAAFPRNPSNTNNVPSVYPDGFLPLIQTKSRDLTATFGVKGDIGAWATNLTASYGKNSIDYSTLHTLNATYGPESPTSFYDGRVSYDQFVSNLDLSHDYLLSPNSDVTVAVGAEYRREGYAIDAGDPDSYDHGPYTVSFTNPPASLSPGAQGFGGFSPANVVDKHRDNVSGYVDLEGKFSNVSVGAAGRVERYSDFGTTANGKLSGRWDITPSFALRGGVQTGFRAPSLQQEYFTSIASVIVDGNVILTGTFPSVSPSAEALGGLPLEPEKSTNYSAGFVFRHGPFNLTTDAYEIDLRNGLTLSQNIGKGFSSAVDAILNANNVASARFFINGVKLRTRGVDVVANYHLATPYAGTFNFTVAGNYNDVKVQKVPTTTSTLDPAPLLVARSTILTLEDGTPETKVTNTIDWNLGPAGATLRGTYYGDVNQAGTTVTSDVHTGDRFIVDLEGRYTIDRRFHLGLGIENLLDTYPHASPAGFSTTGVVDFPFYSPFGFNGRRLYAKLGIDW